MRVRLWLSALLLVPAVSLADNRATYLLHCGGCHLMDGSGTPPEVPSLRDELGRIIQVEGGRDYLVRVPGASQAPVTDAELADIINWILTEFNADTLAPDFGSFTAEEVKNARAHTLADPLKHREALWQRYRTHVKEN